MILNFLNLYLCISIRITMNGAQRGAKVKYHPMTVELRQLITNSQQIKISQLPKGFEEIFFQ